jgi:hypothetical protein
MVLKTATEARCGDCRGMAITPFTILVILSLLFAVAALVPGWNGHALVCVAVILLAVSQFLK